MFNRNYLITRCFSRTFLLFLLSLTVIGILLFVGCKKQDIHDEELQQQTGKNIKEKSWYITNQPVNFFPSDKDGNALSKDDIGKLKTPQKGQQRGLASTCADWDPGFVNGTFTGHVSDILYQRNPNDLVVVWFNYELRTPADPLTTSTANKGRVRVSAGSWPYFAPLKTFTSPLSFTYIDSYYDAVLDATIKRYKVTYSISLKYSDFCSYDTYKTNLTVETNCSSIGIVTTSYQADAQKLTPDSYQPYTYLANGFTGYIQFFPGTCQCSLQCHFPSYGSSPKHQVQYRLNGASSWITLTYTDLLNHNVSVSAGTYQFRSRGVVQTNPEVYSDYSAIQTVVVH